VKDIAYSGNSATTDGFVVVRVTQKSGRYPWVRDKQDARRRQTTADADFSFVTPGSTRGPAAFLRWNKKLDPGSSPG
jgi:hypothetical protein